MDGRRGSWRCRRHLLAGTVLAGGLVALAPGAVQAACVVAVGAINTVTCTGATPTINTSTTDGAGATGFERSYVFTTGTVVATIDGPVSGEGFAVIGPTDAALVSVTANAAVASSDIGLDVRHAGAGAIVVSGSGAATSGDLIGILARHDGVGPAAGTTGVTVTGSGDVTAATGTAISAVMNNAASVADVLVDRTGTVTGRSTGIQATTSGTGNATITGVGDTTTAATSGIGLFARSNGGNVSVTRVGTVTGGEGIRAATTGAGRVTVITGGAVTTTGNSLFGINTFAEAGDTSVTVSHAVSATGTNGAGMRVSATTGNIDVVNNASITGNGTGAKGIVVIGGTANTILNAAGATISGAIGIDSGASGATTVTNAGTITGTGGTAVRFTSGSGNVLVMSGAAATLEGSAVGNGNDRVRFGGAGANTFDVAKIGAGFSVIEKVDESTWTLTGTATSAAATMVSGGTLLVNGNTASSAATVDAGGTLGGIGTVGSTTVNGGTLSPGDGGNAIGILTVQGDLVLATAATYLVDVSPSGSDFTKVTGTATLGGAVALRLAPGTYVTRTTTILSADGGRTGAFDAVSAPAGFRGKLSYTPTDVILTLTAALGESGTNRNQHGVAGALNAYFNAGGVLPPAFAAVFGLTGATLAGTLSQLSGETGAGARQAAFQSTQSFLGLMLDPFVAGRSGGAGGGPLGFAAEPQVNMPDEVALAYAKAMPGAMPAKAPPVVHAPRWSVWGAAYGGAATVQGDAAVGSAAADSRSGGFAAGADYRLLPDTVVGFALAGGGTSWALANGLGSGRSDTFQAGLSGSQRLGAAYVSAALSYAWHDTTTTRTISIGPETLEGRFRPQVFAARGEVGYRFGWAAWGVTPYAAAQVQSFRAPAYTETATAGPGTFALSYAAQTTTATCTELGVWADHRQRVNAETELLLRGRAAWAHDYDTSSRINPNFVALPGASFTVDGAQASPDLALLSAVAELRLQSGIALGARFDGEFGSRSESYAATGTLRYSW